MTHDELVERAVCWLRNSRRCTYVLDGPRPWSVCEYVDAIGWLSTGESIVVECKTSQSDYTANWRKSWRKHAKGMGFWRYYLAETGILSTNDLRGCGLLEIRGCRIKVIQEAEPRQDRDWSEEVRLLSNRLAYHPDKQADALADKGDGENE